jgi:hypothetical protein
VSEILIRFVRGGALDSRLIEWRTRSWASHVEALSEAVGDPKLTFGAQLRGGVAFRYVSAPCYRNVRRSEVWAIPADDAAWWEFWKFLHAQEGKPYDWRAIFAFQFGERDWQEDDSWFCSELVAAALRASGVWRCAGEIHQDRIDPGTAYLIVTSLAGARRVEGK